MAIEFSRRAFVSLVLVAASTLNAAADPPGDVALAFNQPAPPQAAQKAAPQAEQLPAMPSAKAFAGPSTYRLSLEEAKCMTLQNSVIMAMASSQVAAKCDALQAARKDYLPKLLNQFNYFHFDHDLGLVITTPGIFNPATARAVPVVEQDSSIYTAAAIQPITPLLKVRAAVEINEAEVGAAQAQRQQARRELTKGVEQLYIGLLFVGKIKGGLEEAEAASKQMVVATGASSAKVGLIEVQQNLVSVREQYVNLQVQLNQLVGLPPCTELILSEPPEPHNPFCCADEVVNAAVESSPKIREARMLIEKAAGAVDLAKADRVPSVNTFGFYVNQNSTPTIQEDFTGVGASASFLLEWGKKNDVVRQWKSTEVLARQNLQKQIQDLQLAAIKAYNDVRHSAEALGYAQQLAKLNRESKLPTDPFQLKFAVKDRLESEIGAIKADLEYRTAVVEVRSLAGYCECD